VASVDIGGSLREDEGVRQGFVVGALVVTAIACGSFAADVAPAPPAGADGGGGDAIVDAPANHDAPALDASCINGALRFEGDDWLSVPDSDQIVQTHVLAHRDPADVGGYD